MQVVKDSFAYPSRGQSLNLSTLNGKIRVVGSTDDMVRFTSIKRIRAGNPDLLKVRHSDDGAVIHVCVDELGSVDAAVDIQCAAPSNAAVTASAENGDISILDRTTTCQVRLINGPIHIEYEPDATDVACKVTCRNGNALIEVPSDYSGHVDLSVNVGNVVHPFSLQTIGFVKKSVHGAVGEGRASLDISVDVGGIMIKLV